MRNFKIRMFVAAAVIGAVSLVGSGVPVRAHQAQDQKPADEKKPQGGKQAQKAKPQPQKAAPQKPKQEPPGQARQEARRLAQPQQQRLIVQQQQRLVQYGLQLDQYQRLAPQQAVLLQQQNRTAQYGFQLQYVAGMREQQLYVQNARNYDYVGDPYLYTPASYRYSRGGSYYETNDYGANVLRQAVNVGYEQGFHSGQADRQDRWAYGYQDSYAYLDGNFGYRGFYVDRNEYNYYFRQGFRRGYEDGYYRRTQYGVYRDGGYAVQGNVLSVILNLRAIR